MDFLRRNAEVIMLAAALWVAVSEVLARSKKWKANSSGQLVTGLLSALSNVLVSWIGKRR